MPYRIIRLFVLCALLMPLVACTTAQSADPIALKVSTDRIEREIVTICLGSGVFKLVSGIALAAVPAGALAKPLLDAGVDQVCANPSLYAQNIGTIEWLATNLAREKTLSEAGGD